jgi:phospholipase C
MVRLSSLGLVAFAASAVAAPAAESAASQQWDHDHGNSPQPGSAQSIKNLKEKIKNVVLITMENRSLDNLLGGQRIRGLDNPINNGPFCVPRNITNPSLGKVCSQPKDFDSILNDPDHSIHGNNLEFYGTFEPSDADIQSGKLTPNMQGFVHEQIRVYTGKADTDTLSQQVMNYYTEDQVPVLTALTQNFVVFNNWHSGIPGVSVTMLRYQAPTDQWVAHQSQPCRHPVWNFEWPWYQRCWFREERPPSALYLSTAERDQPYLGQLRVWHDRRF